ncbi:MAG: PfkB family carbohydrate kinase [Anaerolineae bacterium]|nr:PfkB family carbohydrate kinase [Anaerolineae bacterium]MDQ7036940.1 PfkB family carbohydrate kinase [Anaerolineae bacterium]
MLDVVCMGELLIDFVALESGVTVGEASGFEKAPGGAPANVAVAIQRLGKQGAFLGQVGDDPFGHYLADVLKADGLNIDGLRFSTKARTMLAFVSLRADGERSFNFYRHPSADMLMTPDDVATDMIDAARVFHFGSITMITSPAKEATLAAAQHAKENGKIITYDPNLRLALWTDAEAARDGMRIGLEYAHVVKVSDEEVDTILKRGEKLHDWFDTFQQLQLILLTHGRNGATAYTRGGKESNHSGYQVQSVDTTGAGDSFVAGVIVNLLEQMGDGADFEAVDYDKLLLFANAAGAMATIGRGAIPSLPTRQQVHDFITTS